MNGETERRGGTARQGCGNFRARTPVEQRGDQRPPAAGKSDGTLRIPDHPDSGGHRPCAVRNADWHGPPARDADLEHHHCRQVAILNRAEPLRRAVAGK